MTQSDATYWARIDNGQAQNPALNLEPISTSPAFEIEIVAATGGDIVLERDETLGYDPDTMIRIETSPGVYQDFFFQYELLGELPLDANQGSGNVPITYQTTPATKAVVLTILDYPSSGTDTRIMFLPNEDATEAEMNAFGNGRIDLQNLYEGGDPDTPDPPPQPACFDVDTKIALTSGLVAAGDIRVGDRVITVDGLPQEVVWVGRSEHQWPNGDVRHKPILISAGALGADEPTHDLIVSPQHHILVRHAYCQQFFSAEEVLAPAKGLIGLPGIRVMQGKKSVVYVHLMLTSHAVVRSAGLWSESFYPGPLAIAGMADDQRKRLMAHLPALRFQPVSKVYGPPARLRITVRQTRLFVSALKGEEVRKTA